MKIFRDERANGMPPDLHHIPQFTDQFIDFMYGCYVEQFGEDTLPYSFFTNEFYRPHKTVGQPTEPGEYDVTFETNEENHAPPQNFTMKIVPDDCGWSE